MKSWNIMKVIKIIFQKQTERACVKDSIRLAKEKGFKPLDSFETLKPGDKVCQQQR